MSCFDLIIVGGGLAGASLAVALRDSRLRIALVEYQPPRRSDGWDARIYAVSPANVEFLRDIGVWKHLDAARITPIRAMQVFGDGGGELNFSAFVQGIHARMDVPHDLRCESDILRGYAYALHLKLYGLGE